jgi:hypothetical protein
MPQLLNAFERGTMSNPCLGSGLTRCSDSPRVGLGAAHVFLEAIGAFFG